MSKVKIDVQDDQAQNESLTQGQVEKPKDVQDLTGFVSWLIWFSDVYIDQSIYVH